MKLLQMMVLRAGMCIAGVSLLLASPANAAIFVDQSFLVNQGFFARFGPNAGIAQSFKQVHGNITGASVQLHENGTGTGDVTIGLFTNLPSLGGVQLASGIVTNVSAGNLATVSFGASPISITPESTYFLVFTGTNGNMGVASSDGLGTGIDLYTRGQGYHSNFIAIPRNDINFQTFYFAPDNTPVPEPSSIILFGSCLAGLGISRMFGRRNLVVRSKGEYLK